MPLPGYYMPPPPPSYYPPLGAHVAESATHGFLGGFGASLGVTLGIILLVVLGCVVCAGGGFLFLALLGSGSH